AGGAPTTESGSDWVCSVGAWSTVATTRTVVARIPLASVVRARPARSVTVCSGWMVSSPMPLSVNVTATLPTPTAFMSVTLKVNTDCSGKPDWRTPMLAGSAPTNCTAAAGRNAVGEGVAVGEGANVGVTVAVGTGVAGPGIVTAACVVTPRESVTTMAIMPGRLPAV